MRFKINSFLLKTSKTYLKDLLSIFVIDNKPHVCEDLSILSAKRIKKEGADLLLIPLSQYLLNLMTLYYAKSCSK
jgi:hypothetical protein